LSTGDNADHFPMHAPGTQFQIRSWVLFNRGWVKPCFR